MKHLIYIFGLLWLIPLNHLGQKNCTWYFGNKAGIEFINGKPKAITTSAMNAVEGSSCVSDANGKLLFYCNGDTIFNSKHVPMKNGTGLNGYWSSTQGSLIVPLPGNMSKFYVFTADAADFNGVKGLCYSVVDMSGENGLGSVAEKNVFVFGPCSEKLNAIQHKNKKDFWIVAHGANDNLFSAWLLTEKGLSAQAVLSNSSVQFSTSVSPGQMKFSPDGNMLAAALYSSSEANVLLYHFDLGTGKLTDELRIKSIDASSSCYGVEFSPDGKQLLIASTMTKSIFVAKLGQWSADAINSSFSKVGYCSSSYLWGMQLGPDGRIYVAHDSWPQGDQYLGVLECWGKDDWKYTDNGFYLEGRKVHLGLPTVLSAPVIWEEPFVHEPDNLSCLNNERLAGVRETIPGEVQLQIKKQLYDYDPDYQEIYMKYDNRLKPHPGLNKISLEH